MSPQNNGCTLLELLIVLTIVIILFSAGTMLSVGAYTSYVVQAEHQILVSVLHRARSQALTRVHATVHGVCYASPYYIIFEGTVCAPDAQTSERIYAARYVAEASGFEETFPTILFTQHTATTTPVDIYLHGDAMLRRIQINEEGTILW